MKLQKRIITELDLRRLELYLQEVKTQDQSDKCWGNKLKQLLDNAKVITPERISGDIVTMNSIVKLKDNNTNHEMVINVIFPFDVDKRVENFKTSILSPIGLAVFGRQVGEKICNRIKLEDIIYQPEAEGDFHL